MVWRDGVKMSRTIKLNEIEHFFRDGSKVPDDYWKTFVNSENNYSKNEDMWDGEEVVLKKWKLEEILEKYSPPNPSWSGRSCDYDLPHSGFEDVGSIDLRILFGDYSAKDQNHGFFKGGTWTSIPLNIMYACNAKGYRSLWQIKDKIEACLNKVDYKNRELIIYRSYGMANHGFSWDEIRIFSEKRVSVGN
jgi:hypothetical protein